MAECQTRLTDPAWLMLHTRSPAGSPRPPEVRLACEYLGTAQPAWLQRRLTRAAPRAHTMRNAWRTAGRALEAAQAGPRRSVGAPAGALLPGPGSASVQPQTSTVRLELVVTPANPALLAVTLASLSPAPASPHPALTVQVSLRAEKTKQKAEFMQWLGKQNLVIINREIKFKLNKISISAAMIKVRNNQILFYKWAW